MPSLPQLEKLLAAEPNDTFVLYALAQEHANSGNAAQAIAFYDRVLALDPHYCYAYFHKAKVQHDSGDLASALTTAQAGLDAARKSGDRQALGELSGLLDEWE
jgi:tetratricopeptide (TPR) repeat protein